MNSSLKSPFLRHGQALIYFAVLLSVCLAILYISSNLGGERLGLVLLPGLLLFTYALFSLELTTYVFAFFLFTQIARGLELPGGFFLVTAFFFAVWLLHKFIVRDDQIYLESNGLLILCYVFFLLVSVLDARWQTPSYVMLWMYAKIFLIYFVLVDLLNNERVIQNVIWVIIFSAVFSCLYGVYNFLTNVQEGNVLEIAFRLRGVSGNPNILAINILFAFSFLCYYFLLVYKHWLTRLVLIVAIFAAVAALAATVSRAGIIALGVAFMILTWQFRERKWPVALFLLVAVLAVIYLPEDFVDRLALILDPEKDPSLRWRFKLYVGAIELIQQHPFNGVGLGNFTPLSINYIGKHLDTHNSFLELWSESCLLYTSPSPRDPE